MLVRDGIIIVGVVLYLSLFNNYDLLPNRWGKHYTGWTIALFIIILLGGLVEGVNNLTVLNIQLILEKLALMGVIIFLILSMFSYIKDQGSKIFNEIT